uniref:Uncharacterized protein n=1 Tax=Araucaria cunninghamii TaxID=56994 RepID=A0A0D6R811_ARACU
MSDDMRKGVTDKAQEKLTPESEKSYLDKAKEGATGAADSVAGAVQPEGDKSVTQSASDAMSSKPGEKGIVEQMQDGAGAALNYAKETGTDVYNKVTEATSGNK